MGVSQEKIIKGILRYAREQVIPRTDGSFKMVLSMGLGIFEAKPSKLEAIFDHPLIHNEDGEYDIDLLEEVVCKTVDEFGGFTITIPPLKFVTDSESTLTFNSNDVRDIITLIRGA